MTCAWSKHFCIAALAGALLTACTATETGNPSIVEIDPDAVTGMFPDNEPVPETELSIVIEGEPGAVEPPEGEIWVWDLDVSQSPRMTPVDADGSLRLTLSTMLGHTLRLQARTLEGELSQPLDLRVTIDGLELVTIASATQVLTRARDQCSRPRRLARW